MCLQVHQEKTKEMRKGKEWIPCYKRLEIINKYDGDIIISPYQGYKYKLDTNVLEVTRHLNTTIRRRVVSYGIHAYTTEYTAQECTWCTSVVVKCYGHIDDLLGVGKYNDIAFNKLYIAPRAYQRLLNIIHGKGKYTYEYV